MKSFAPEFSALITILRSTGPVISTRRSCKSAGMGAIVQSPWRICAVSGKKSGSLPASISSWRCARRCSNSSRRGPKVRASVATKPSASGVKISANSALTGAVISICSWGVVWVIAGILSFMPTCADAFSLKDISWRVEMQIARSGETLILRKKSVWLAGTGTVAPTSHRLSMIFARVRGERRHKISSMELLGLGRAGQSGCGREAAGDHLGHLVEVAGADLALVFGGGIAERFKGKFGLLELRVSGHTVLAIAEGQFKHAVVEGVETGQSDKLELIPHLAQFLLESRDGPLVQLLTPVERR